MYRSFNIPAGRPTGMIDRHIVREGKATHQHYLCCPLGALLLIATLLCIAIIQSWRDPSQVQLHQTFDVSIPIIGSEGPYTSE